jgi:hypothetical protein
VEKHTTANLIVFQVLTSSLTLKPVPGHAGIANLCKIYITSKLNELLTCKLELSECDDGGECGKKREGRVLNSRGGH